jgi:hypothetical protein
MFFVVDNARLKRMIRLVRDDKKKKLQGKDSPFLRLAAQGNSLSVAGVGVSATFPATVYEEGVLFLRTTMFRKLLTTFVEEKFMSLQVDESGLHIGNVFLSFDALDMVLFPNVGQAPEQWPAKLPESELRNTQEKGLFDTDETK